MLNLISNMDQTRKTLKVSVDVKVDVAAIITRLYKIILGAFMLLLFAFIFLLKDAEAAKTFIVLVFRILIRL